MADIFNLKAFLVENKLTTNSRMITEGKEKGDITILKDIYYFDKLNKLSPKDSVDEKHHKGSKLVFKKNTTVKDDSEYDDSEYKMITNSRHLVKGKDYKVSSN